MMVEKDKLGSRKGDGRMKCDENERKRGEGVEKDGGCGS